MFSSLDSLLKETHPFLSFLYLCFASFFHISPFVFELNIGSVTEIETGILENRCPLFAMLSNCIEELFFLFSRPADTTTFRLGRSRFDISPFNSLLSLAGAGFCFVMRGIAGGVGGRSQSMICRSDLQESLCGDGRFDRSCNRRRKDGGRVLWGIRSGLGALMLRGSSRVNHSRAR